MLKIFCRKLSCTGSERPSGTLNRHAPSSPLWSEISAAINCSRRACAAKTSSNPLRRTRCPAQRSRSMTTLYESRWRRRRLVLERLPPKERLVFLLREVLDYEYEEIATLIRKSATNCRQILARARKHLTAGWRVFTVDPHQLEKLKRQFALTCRTGDLRSLVTSLSLIQLVPADGHSRL